MTLTRLGRWLTNISAGLCGWTFGNAAWGSTVNVREDFILLTLAILLGLMGLDAKVSDR
jgi:hypothetical protein